MAKKKTLEELQTEQMNAERELKIAKQNIRILQHQAAELTRRERTHRLCTHGAMLEQYLKPEVFTDEQIEEILRTIFRRNDVTVFINDIAKQVKSADEADTS
ncbi:MAG: DUF3847 domain-containing protein [Eubacterium sp.]|nr:DUF3847 domain-containing protein [Eubacterium sp.]